MQMGVGVSNFLEKKCYEGVRFDVNSVTRGWVGVQFPGKKRYVTLEWPHIHILPTTVEYHKCTLHVFQWLTQV